MLRVEWLCSFDIIQEASMCAVQVHTYDHTLPPKVQAAVTSIPGVNFHSMGITG